MAKFPTRKRTKRAFSGATFIQRSREESSEQKAMWHQVLGAGRGHVKRPFFDLGPDDERAIEQALGAALEQRVGQ